jgi:hypothetical protein
MSAADAALYTTIWLSLILFVAGEAGRRTSSGARVGLRSPWALWTVGAFLCAAHMALAMGLRHGWSHSAAMRATAAQTEAVYGIAWGGGVFVNYAFAIAWLAEALWWRWSPTRGIGSTGWARPVRRAFYLLILINAAIVFVPPDRRPFGVALIAALLWAWRPNPGVTVPSSPPAVP